MSPLGIRSNSLKNRSIRPLSLGLQGERTNDLRPHSIPPTFGSNLRTVWFDIQMASGSLFRKNSRIRHRSMSLFPSLVTTEVSVFVKVQLRLMFLFSIATARCYKWDAT